VSTDDQNLTNQRAELEAAGCTKIFAEKITGTKRDRPELDRVLDHLRVGDVVTVTRLDRLARNTRDLLDIAERIKDAGAGLRSLAEPWADTTTAAGRMVLTVFAGIAEFERSLIIDRTKSGREAAKRRGVKFGPPPSLSEAQIAHARRLIDQEGRTIKEAAELLGVHRSTLYRALNRSAAVADVEVAERLAIVRNALASQRIEGLEPDVRAVVDAEKWAHGEIEISDAIERAKANIKGRHAHDARTPCKPDTLIIRSKKKG
jgi:DNA invertase Pin-like site-specific DNA recombinase